MSNYSRNEALVYLYTKYAGAVFGRCIVLVHDYSLAEDCMQETFVRLYKRYDEIEKGNLSAWLMRTLVYVCRDAVKKRSAEEDCAVELNRRTGLEIEKGFSEPQTRLPIFSALEENEFLGRLSLEEKQIYDMRFCKDMKIADIADELGCSTAAAKMRLKRFLRRAEKYFTEK